MTPLFLLEALNYGLVLLYGIFLSTAIAGSAKDNRILISVFSLLLLLLQTVVAGLLGVEAMRRFYPLLVHLPLILLLIFGLQKTPGIAATSVFTAYLLCQLPRWVKLLVLAVVHLPMVGEIAYTLSIIPFFLLLQRFFAPAARSAMTASRRSMLLFGSLPLAYYIFDYAAAVYSDLLYAHVVLISEFLPTALIVFYVLFLTAYHSQMEAQNRAELQHFQLEAALRQSSMELESLRRAESRTAIYQHDMRHHLAAIERMLAAGEKESAEAYIRTVRQDVEKLTPRHFCENTTVDLLCASYTAKAEQRGIKLEITAKLPDRLPIADPNLCSILSNGLENALTATADLEPLRRWITLYCDTKLNKLLIEIKNPYNGTVRMEDGIPTSDREGHGYGCRSICNIARQAGGLCNFETENGIFTLQIILPLRVK